jgi:hypothetical protein
MPYHLEKGPLLAVLDDFCNGGSTARLLKALLALRAGTALVDVGLFDSPNLYSGTYPPPYAGPDQLKEHFNNHWLGNPGPSHWQSYDGPVEAIMRETLIRALELILGVRHDPTNQAPSPTRHWTVDFWWKCPQPWFEGWVTWRQHGGQGKVTVIFATPADDGVVLRDPTTEATPVPNAIATADEGSWLISSKLHTQTATVTVAPSGFGIMLFPTTTTWTTDDPNVVVVSPWFGSGGARYMPYVGNK